MNPSGLLVITFSSESLETTVLHTDIKLVTVCPVSILGMQNTSFLLKLIWLL